MSQDGETHGNSTSGHKFRVGQRIRSAGYFAIFITLMMGLTALAMHTAESNTRRIQQRIAAEAAAAKIEVVTTDAYASEFAGEPVQPLKLEETPATKRQQTTMSSLAQASPVCNQTKKAQATATKTQKLRQETVRHKRVVWSIRSSGLVTRLLNPGMTSYRLSSEKNTHAKNIQHIGYGYQRALRLAHCL